ncbi:MAG: mercury resistance system periplasmic binding protein MerP [Steroidobacteraceae bacterium]
MRRSTLIFPTLLSMLLTANAAFAAPSQTTTLAVEKMTCGTCPIVVKKALSRVPGVTDAHVDLGTKTAVVTFDPDKATTARLIEATTAAGFPSKLVAKP